MLSILTLGSQLWKWNMIKMFLKIFWGINFFCNNKFNPLIKMIKIVCIWRSIFRSEKKTLLKERTNLHFNSNECCSFQKIRKYHCDYFQKSFLEQIQSQVLCESAFLFIGNNMKIKEGKNRKLIFSKVNILLYYFDEI